METPFQLCMIVWVLTGQALPLNSTGESEHIHQGLRPTTVEKLKNTSEPVLDQTHSQDDVTNPASPVTNISSDDDMRMSRIEEVTVAVYKYYIPTASTLGFLGCIITLIILHRGALKSSSSVYIRGIAAANLIITVLYIGSSLNRHGTTTPSLGWRNFNSYFELVRHPLRYISMSALVWTIIAFAVERMIAIYYPMKSRIVSSENRAKKVVIGIFFVSVLVNITHIFSYTIVTNMDPVTNGTLHVRAVTKLGASPINREVTRLIFMTGVVLVPLVLLAIINLAILVKLKQAKRSQRNLTDARTDEASQDKYAQIQRVLIASVFAFLFCNILVAVNLTNVAIYGPAYRNVYWRQIIPLSMSLLYVLNPFLNFVIYVCCSKILRKAVVKLICAWKKAGPTTKRDTNVRFKTIFEESHEVSTGRTGIHE